MATIGSAVIIAAAFLILPALGVSVANAQRPTENPEPVRPVTRVQEPASPILEQPQQPIVGQTTGAQGQEPLVPNFIVAPSRPFTLASSVGTVDEDSAALVQFRNFTATLLPGATGSVHVRYNLTAVDGISGFCPATQSIVRVRFRNSDNGGVTAQVLFEIHQTNVTAGGNNIIYTFSSNTRGAGGAFTTATDSPAIDFDFANSIYWIEATVLRTDPNAFADLGSIQIWEAAGTACP